MTETAAELSTESSLVSRAGLTDADLSRMLSRGLGGWLRGVTRRVTRDRISFDAATRMIARRADAVSPFSRVPVPVLVAVGIAIKAAHAIGEGF